MTSSRSVTRTEVDTGSATGWKKYDKYPIEVDRLQDDKATEILLCNFERPHMRAFHCSWFAFFVAFFVWFSITPLIPEIQKSLGLSNEEIWTSNIANVTGTIFMRVLLGPLCDKVGPRILFAVVLGVSAIPAACIGFVHTTTGLTIIRSFIGLAGGTFVMCQYWTSSMFTKEIVATANGLVAGWGNLGAGVTQLLVGTLLFPLFKEIFKGTDNPTENAWRTVCIFPAVLAVITGVFIYKLSDDTPKGNFNELKKNGSMGDPSAIQSFRKGFYNINTWILLIQYGCCFGVELTMNSAAAAYFHDTYRLTTDESAAIASIFGWMNLFARGLGGWISDILNMKWGMRGRLYAQLVLLILEGGLVLIFANSNSLIESINIMVFFSMFVQAAEGSTYGIVPYVDPDALGAVTGIVGAGGNLGAVAFGMAFRDQEIDERKAFFIMGCSILASAVTTIFITIDGHRCILFGKDSVETQTQKRNNLTNIRQ
ncbi:unnamed protein product [Cylindrotheca closterium]|uniref:Nitrate/nitrite transporter n=1 Tax=Cylindrotheca closterium TaxID=2856 RepID=A0AAD2G500_9STRA|nr:unnamed protein product [Cylindrotheca closterium]